MSKATRIDPVGANDFDLDFLYAEEAKANGTLEERASVTDLGLRHMAAGDQEFAQRVRLNREKAREELERLRLVNKAKAKEQARRDAQFDGPREGEKWEDFIKRNPRYLVSISMLNEIVDGTIDAIREVKDKQDEQIKALESRIRELENQPDKTLKFCGEWSNAETYEPNDICHNAGSAWVATMRSTGVRPSTGDYASMCWQLFVSRGRPGKNARGPDGQ